MKKAIGSHKDAVNTLNFLSNGLQESPGTRGGVAVDEDDFLKVVYCQVVKPVHLCVYVRVLHVCVWL